MEVDILLVEDNVADVHLVTEALREARIPHKLDLACDGEAALANLRARTIHPDLVLLDLNLPKLSGIEVLKAIKQDPALRVISVVVLSNSTAPPDVSECYLSYANAYIRKPQGFAAYTKTMTQVGEFWFQTVVLPGQVGTLQQASMLTMPPAPPPRRRTSGTMPSSVRPRKK